jgi:predicted acylesterase/phospholipase RssA
MGALIGGIYAAGELDKFEHWVRAVTKIDIVTLLDVSWNKSGLLKGDKIINTLVELVGNQRIEDLPISIIRRAARRLSTVNACSRTMRPMTSRWAFFPLLPISDAR